MVNVEHLCGIYLSENPLQTMFIDCESKDKWKPCRFQGFNHHQLDYRINLADGDFFFPPHSANVQMLKGASLRSARQSSRVPPGTAD